MLDSWKGLRRDSLEPASVESQMQETQLDTKTRAVPPSLDPGTGSLQRYLNPKPYMSHGLNALKGGYIWDYYRGH